MQSLIEAAGGTSAPIRAVLLGGYGGTWLDGGSVSALALSRDHLAGYGASLGPGVVVLLGAAACPVAEVTRVTRWLAGQSAGQCGPCVNGLDAIASALEEVLEGQPSAGVGKRIARWSTLAKGRGACRHPDGVVNFVASALEVFAEELADHAQHGPCDACMGPHVLPLPTPIELAAAAA